MMPHQERVVAERDALGESLDKLTRFMTTDVFHSLDVHERARLVRQNSYMSLYALVLTERIDAFA